MNDRSPELHKRQFHCPRCGAYANQEWVSLVAISDIYAGRAFEDEQIFVQVDPDTVSQTDEAKWQACHCTSCEKYSVWRGEVLIFPKVDSLAEPPHEQMDAAAKVIYQESAAVLPISRRASAALARAAMEVQLKALGIGKPNDRLDERIADLSAKVSEPLWKALTALRDAGNKALHESQANGLVAILLDGSDSELARFLLSAINQIVDELIARPQRANEVYDLLPQGVREAAENKRASKLATASE